MTRLANKLNKAQAILELEKEPFKRRTISFYKYVRIENPDQMRDELWRTWQALGVKGRVYVAHEGINAQISVPEPLLDIFRTYLNLFKEFKNVPFKFGLEEHHLSFWKLTVKVRSQIVADGLPEEAYDVENVGRHLTAEEWNEAMDNGAIVVDMRNAYESDIGHFKGAIRPESNTFRDELPEVLEKLKGKEQEKILLYCTGGVRCEKTSAFLREHGFDDVNQLHGGIIEYTHQVKQQSLPNQFIGANYVFDGRKIETITEDKLANCYTCKTKTNQIVNCANPACHAIMSQCESCTKKTASTCSQICRDILALPEEEQRKIRQKTSDTFRVLR